MQTWQPSKPGSSTATVGWLVPLLISPSTGSALTGAPHRGTFFLCKDSFLCQQRLSVCRLDLPLLPYTATCFLCLLREQKSKHHVLLCSVCRTRMLRVTPPLGRICHLTVTLIFWLKISFPSGSFSANWIACSNYGKFILHQPWKTTSLTSQPGLRCVSNWGWLLDCSILSFLHICLNQTHLLHATFVCRSVCTKKPEEDICMLSLCWKYFSNINRMTLLGNHHLFLGKGSSWIVL